jgi:hypothetical protein
LFTNLHLGLPSCLFPSGFPTKSYMHSSSSPFVQHVLPISSSLTWFGVYKVLWLQLDCLIEYRCSYLYSSYVNFQLRIP